MGLRFTIHAQDKTKQAFESVKSHMRGINKSFGKLRQSLSGMNGLIAGAFAGAGIRSVVQATDKIDKFSLRLGVSTKNLSELKFAGEQTGVSFNQLSVGLQRMTRRISEVAATGSGPAVDALDELGLSAQRLNSLSADEQFMEIAKAMQSVEKQSDKVRLAFKLFDSEGVGLLQTMEGGADAVNKLRSELNELGGAISEEQADAIAGLSDQWNKVTVTVQGFVRVLLTELKPALEGMMTLFTKVAKSLTTLIKKFTSGITAVSIKTQELLGIIDEDIADDALINLGKRWDEVNEKTKKAVDQTKVYMEQLNGGASGGVASGGKKSVPTVKSGASSKRGGLGMDLDSHLEDWKISTAEAERTSNQIKDIFKDGITSVITDFDNLGDALTNTMKRFSDMMLQQSLDGLFGGGFGGGMGGGIGSAIAGMFSGSGGGTNFGGFFADGGAFGAGKPIVVGENGPELIMPRQSGTVIPNHAMGTGSAVNVTMNISTPNAQSFRASQTQLSADMAAAIAIAQRRNM